MSASFARANVETFFRTDFARYARATFGAGARASFPSDEFRAVWGASPPRELVRFVRALPEETGKVLFGVVPGYGAPVGSGEDNLLERMIVDEQEDVPGSHLLMALSGAVRIGTAQNGDSWLLGLYDHVTVKPMRTPWARSGAIYPLDQETRVVEPAVADGIESFTYLNAISEGLADGSLSEAEFRKAFGKLRKRIALTPHFEALEAFALPNKRDRARFRYRAEDEVTRLLFSRSLWIYYLLKNDPTVTVHDIPNFFAEKANEKISPEIWRRWMARVDKIPATALYVLFRCFFFGANERLEEALAVSAKSRSRFTRDASSLVRELARGRRTLGSIRDVHELREELRAKQLDPDRPVERSAVRRDKKRAEAAFALAARKSNTVTAAPADERDSILWSKCDDPAAVREFWREMRGEESLAQTFAIVDSIDSDAHVHDNMVVTLEREESLLALSMLGSKRVVPLLLSRANKGDRKAVEMLGALGDPRSIPHLEALLRGPSDPYRRLEVAVVRALRRLRAVSTVPTLRRVFDENPLSDWRKGIERGELVRELILTLGELGDPSAEPTLLAAFTSPLKEYKELMPASARALGNLRALGSADRLVAHVQSLGAPPSVEFVWALGRLASKHAGARATLRGLVTHEPGAEAVRLSAVGTPEQFAEAFSRATREPAYRLVETLERRTWAWRAFGERGGVPLTDAEVQAAVTTDEHEVRAAAINALERTKRALPDTRYYFRVVVDAIERKGGAAALAEAVVDPLGVFRYNAALRLSALGESMGHVAEAARALFATTPLSSFDYMDAPHDLEWFVRALARSSDPGARGALLEGLSSKNPQVRALVAEHASLDERTRLLFKPLLSDESALVRSRAEKALSRALS